MGRALIAPARASDIARALGLRHVGPDRLIRSVEPIQGSRPGSLSFAKTTQHLAHLDPEAVVILPEDEACITRVEAGEGTGLVGETSRLSFACALEWLGREIGFASPSEAAIVHPSARIGQNVVLGAGVTIGPRTIILHNVVIGDDVSIGADCVIKSGAVIGEDGFGFERHPDGRAQRLPHLGRVLIEDDVEIGSLTTVCRGTLDDTVIKRGAKIDDHVHIAHNVVVGEDAFVIACAEVSGGVEIGAQAWVSPNASIKNQLKIGARATVGLGAVVVRSVSDDEVVAGNPAKSLAKS